MTEINRNTDHPAVTATTLPAVLAELAARAQAGEYTGAVLLMVLPDRSVETVTAGSACADPYRLAGMCLALAHGAMTLPIK